MGPCVFLTVVGQKGQYKALVGAVLGVLVVGALESFPFLHQTVYQRLGGLGQGSAGAF